MHQCSICFEDTSKEYYIRLDCGPHDFHPHCIFKWFLREGSCPNCRATKFKISGQMEPTDCHLNEYSHNPSLSVYYFMVWSFVSYIVWDKCRELFYSNATQSPVVVLPLFLTLYSFHLVILKQLKYQVR